MSNQKWPCIFAHEFTKEQVNNRLAEVKAPIGAFTRAWRWEHCAMINPYGSEACPYEPEDCALAYLKTAQDAMAEANTSVVGLFKALAKRRGIDRAENKPLARDRVRRTDGLQAGTGDLRRGAGTGSMDVVPVVADGSPHEPRTVDGIGTVGVRGEPDHGDHGRRARPQSVGALLRGDGAGSRPRTRRWDEREESTDNDGDTGDPVSPPPSRRLGDSPPPGDPGVHQGGE